MKDAARYVRDLRLRQPQGENTLLMFRSLSGAVWRDDVTLGRRLLQTCEPARQYIEVTAIQVNLRDFAQGHQLRSEARAAALSERDAKSIGASSFKMICAMRRKLNKRAAL
eukprot:6539200-Pyramimonas_sp.AAC.1